MIGFRAVTSRLDRLAAAQTYPNGLAISKNGRVLFVATKDIDWVEAEGNYIRLHVGNREHEFRETLAGLEEKLNPSEFLRIHRSTIVNIQRIKEIQAWFHGHHRVLLEDGTELPRLVLLILFGAAGHNWHYCVTVNTPELTAVPLGVVMVIFPVTAPVGTSAVTCLSESTLNVVAGTPPKVTLVVPMKVVPIMTTGVPTLPLVGLNDLMNGVTMKMWLLVSVLPDIVTVTEPVEAPAGTVPVKEVEDTTLKLAAFPLNETLFVPLNP